MTRTALVRQIHLFFISCGVIWLPGGNENDIRGRMLTVLGPRQIGIRFDQAPYPTFYFKVRDELTDETANRLNDSELVEQEFVGFVSYGDAGLLLGYCRSDIDVENFGLILSDMLKIAETEMLALERILDSPRRAELEMPRISRN